MLRSKLESYLNTVLALDSIEDFSYNGIQFEGTETVTTIGFAVDAGVQTFEKAASAGVDFLIVHHGLFWKKQNPVLTGVHKKRIDILYKNDITLYAAHLPLDCHETVGNNAGLMKLIGAVQTDGISPYGRVHIGSFGEFEQPQSIDSIVNTLESKLQCKTSQVIVSDKPIKKVAILSGACSRGDIHEAAEKGADLFITGESSEFFHDAHDYDISVIFAGHHASETVGVSLLMKQINTQFPELETTFISCPTGL